MQVRGDVLCPLYCTDELLRESHRCLIENLGEEEAAEIMALNPAVLTCGDGLLAADPEEIRRLAKVRSILDKVPPAAWWVVSVSVGVLLTGKVALVRLGFSDPVF